MQHDKEFSIRCIEAAMFYMREPDVVVEIDGDHPPTSTNFRGILIETVGKDYRAHQSAGAGND